MRLVPGLLLIGASLFLCPSASADCDRPPSAATALTRATVVFRGVTREVKVVGSPGSWRGWIVTFTVFESWKGAPRRDFTLHVTALSEDDAYEDFRPGEQYVVFADVNVGRKAERFGLRGTTYGAHGCGGTGALSHADSYLKELGPGQPVP